MDTSSYNADGVADIYNSSFVVIDGTFVTYLITLGKICTRLILYLFISTNGTGCNKRNVDQWEELSQTVHFDQREKS